MRRNGIGKWRFDFELDKEVPVESGPVNEVGADKHFSDACEFFVRVFPFIDGPCKESSLIRLRNSEIHSFQDKFINAEGRLFVLECRLTDYCEICFVHQLMPFVFLGL